MSSQYQDAESEDRAIYNEPVWLVLTDRNRSLYALPVPAVYDAL